MAVCKYHMEAVLWFICLLGCQIVQLAEADSSELKPHIFKWVHTKDFLLNYALNYIVLGLRLCTDAGAAAAAGAGAGVAFIDKSTLVV